jgi:hypothetical protein
MPLSLPLILAGPILRRVEPTLVSVWLALTEAATVRITLWDGRVTAGSGNPWFTSDPPGTPTLRAGAKLHVVVATVKIPRTSPRLLQPGHSYSYDCEIVTAGGSNTLKSLGLLNSGDAGGKRIEALGFEENFLPSFALPPAELTDLRIVYGSCRLPPNGHLDAMAQIDDLMRENPEYDFRDPSKRPHQLHLGGDQIYADDVSPVHLYHLIDLGKELIGTRSGNGEAIETLRVAKFRTRKVDDPKGFGDYSDADGAAPLPADHAYFPAGRRFLLTTVDAQMTTVDAQSHLFSIGEFASMYLSVWSNAVWPALAVPSPGQPAVMPLPTDEQLITATWPARIPTLIDAPIDADEKRQMKADGKVDKESPFNNYKTFKEESDEKDLTVPKRLEGHRKLMRDFERGLAKVRRVLANIPTYMIFDDHDVTDDWNLNPLWLDRVLTTPLGVTIIRNAYVAYALFQDWGNDPLKYENPLDDKNRLLGRIAALFPPGAEEGPNAAAADAIDVLVGLNLRPPEDIDGTFPETRPPLKWHFSISGPGFVVAVLDNRTRRSFGSRNGPPGNVAITAQPDQIPSAPLPDGAEILIVIAPLQVIGAPIFDELVAPAAYRAFDMVSFTFKNEARQGLRGGSRGMAGTNPDAIEAWAFEVKTFEALLARLEPHRRVVLLSGDVHYSASTAMSYWLKGQADPARILQFTSSGFKNVMPSYIGTIDRSLAPAQQLIRVNIGAERLAWNRKQNQPILLDPGSTEEDIPRALRGKLNHEPVLVPTYGWPKGSTVNPATPPDWQWRVEPVIDLRPDAERPEAARPLEIDKDGLNAVLAVSNSPRTIDAYQQMAARHQRTLQLLRNSRQILFRSNFGVLRFERPGGVLQAVNEIYTAVPKTATDEPKPELFVRHVAPLSTPGVTKPEATLQPLKPEAQI